MLSLLIVIVVLYIMIQVWQISVLLTYKNPQGKTPDNWPQISIWVAARNEEDNIGKCLESLVHLDYPADKLTIIVGNDQSTDRTGEIARNFESKYNQIKVIDIHDDDSGLKAKARVMAQIDKHAVGEYYLITDADVQIKPEWAKTLICYMEEKIGVASGTTMVSGNSISQRLQGIDWAYFMGLLNVISYSGVPATAVGNNMIVRKDAYWQTGGYGAIKFSITEDYKLYSEICAKGWKWNNIMAPGVLGESAATEGFKGLLHQRKRWLSGGKELPWYWWLLFGIFALFYFAIPVMLFVSPALAIGLWLIKFTIQYFQIQKIHDLVKANKPTIAEHLLYEIYLSILTISTAIFFLLPLKTIWKGRSY